MATNTPRVEKEHTTDIKAGNNVFISLFNLSPPQIMQETQPTNVDVPLTLISWM
jgi:hypothetical protein